MEKRILIVAAHPDDEILGCGGTIAKLTNGEYRVYTAILGEGVTARDPTRDKTKRESELKELKKMAKKANKVLGVKEIFFYDLPDNRFDSLNLLDVIKLLEDLIQKVKPTIIFTHHRNDLNIDHQVTYRAVLTATRPVPGQTVKKIFSFEVLSSTEWAFPNKFTPNLFIELSEKELDLKCEAMEQYSTELREYPHPRSLETIRLNAALWGSKVGVRYAEAFEVIRELLLEGEEL